MACGKGERKMVPRSMLGESPQKQTSARPKELFPHWQHAPGNHLQLSAVFLPSRSRGTLTPQKGRGCLS